MQYLFTVNTYRYALLTSRKPLMKFRPVFPDFSG